MCCFWITFNLLAQRAIPEAMTLTNKIERLAGVIVAVRPPWWTILVLVNPPERIYAFAVEDVPWWVGRGLSIEFFDVLPSAWWSVSSSGASKIKSSLFKLEIEFLYVSSIPASRSNSSNSSWLAAKWMPRFCLLLLLVVPWWTPLLSSSWLLW